METTAKTIADDLETSFRKGPKEYAAALGRHWSLGEADLRHEPPLPQDCPMSREQILAERNTIDTAFHSLMPDFRYEDIYCRVVGPVIYLFAEQVGTLPDGAAVRSALCSRFTIVHGRIEAVVLAIDPDTIKPLYEAFHRQLQAAGAAHEAKV